jgi:hypothetical protein
MLSTLLIVLLNVLVKVQVFLVLEITARHWLHGLAAAHLLHAVHLQ